MFDEGEAWVHILARNPYLSASLNPESLSFLTTGGGNLFLPGLKFTKSGEKCPFYHEFLQIQVILSQKDPIFSQYVQNSLSLKKKTSLSFRPHLGQKNLEYAPMSPSLTTVYHFYSLATTAHLQSSPPLYSFYLLPLRKYPTTSFQSFAAGI